jgi:4-amino-4-deoxy-L-arabinose transferase-like glycosyltransferase
MTSIAPPTTDPRTARTGILRGRAWTRSREASWVLPATIGVLVFAAVLYLVNLTVSGYGNVYYSAAAWAASQDWSAWFFGSIDPSNFITVDKPPLATMVLGISVRLFGLDPASILVPQALMGVASVAILMATVRRTFGAPASIIAGLVMALTPAAVLIFRFNNPDALLTLLLVGAAYAFIRALETDRNRWVVLAGVLVGLGFETKLLQAYLVLPAFAITFAIAAPGSIRHRVIGLTVALAALVVGSAWWIAAVELTPVAARPYIGGSTDNSALDLVLGYDGLGRIFGQGGGGGGPAGGGPGGGGGFSGTPGILRLFNAQLGGQIAWLLPISLVGLVAGLVARFRAPRTDLARAAFLMWGLWLLVHAAVFSLMSGIIHSYYAVVMAPAVGALVGGGVMALWAGRKRFSWAGVVLGVSILGSAVVAWLLLERTPDFFPGLGIALVVVAAILIPVLALRPQADRARAQLIALALGVGVLLAAPAAYAADTMATAYSGGDAAAGPRATGTDGGPGGLAGSALGGQPPASMTGDGANGASAGAQPNGAARLGGAGGGPGGPGASVDPATLDYLVANQGSARWIVAVSGANGAGQIELETGKAVMAMGGFSGSDNTPTVDQLKAYVASGELRFIVVGAGGGGGGPFGGSSSVTDWVTSSCTAVDQGTGSTSLYDCSGAAAG